MQVILPEELLSRASFEELTYVQLPGMAGAKRTVQVFPPL
jgi:hypothetical protein